MALSGPGHDDHTSTFVLQRVKTFFDSLNAKLPLPTRMLLAIYGFISAWWSAIFEIIVILVVGCVAMRRSTRGRAKLDPIS